MAITLAVKCDECPDQIERRQKGDYHVDFADTNIITKPAFFRLFSSCGVRVLDLCAGNSCF